MVKDLTQKIGSSGIAIELPIRRSSALSHLDNINYCIKQIRRYSEEVSEPVVGYVLARGLGTRETHHRILPRESAEHLRTTNTRFNYITLDNFLMERADIEKGKYIVRDGLIVDLNPSYSH